MSYKSYKDFIEDPGKVYFLKRKASFGNIIDFEKKGNRVVFYLGYKDDEWGWTNKNYKDQTGKTPDWLKPSDDYYGDDWDDASYEHNAGRVYDEFIQTVRIYYYDTDWKIIEPCDGEINSKYSKEDFKNGKVPCIIIIRDELAQKFDNEYRFSFSLLDNLKGSTNNFVHDFLESGSNILKCNSTSIPSFLNPV